MEKSIWKDILPGSMNLIRCSQIGLRQFDKEHLRIIWKVEGMSRSCGIIIRTLFLAVRQQEPQSLQKMTRDCMER